MRATLHTNITLKEMLEDLVKWVLGEECKYGGEFYYRNGEGGYFEITEVDLMRSRFETEDDLINEFVDIYKNIDKLNMSHEELEEG